MTGRPPHAIGRAQARYGLTLTVDDLIQIATDIQENKGTLIKLMPDKSSAWLIEVKGKLCKIVMSPLPYLNHVITFLPFNAYSVLDSKGKPAKNTGRSKRYIEKKRDHRHGSQV